MSDFKGKKFQFVEIALGYEGNRGTFTTLSQAQKLVKKEEAWRSIYTYCDINDTEVNYSGYYFESDIQDFELNRSVILYAINFLNINYDIPLEAFKFKFTNKSIWVEIVPSVMGIKPMKNLNLVFKRITEFLNTQIELSLKIKKALDTSVYSNRQLTRLSGSYLPLHNRYVIELSYFEIENYTYKKILDMAKNRRKLMYVDNNEFFVSKEGAELFSLFKHLELDKRKVLNKSNNNQIDYSKERVCITNIEKEGVERGFRNLALFYASIDKRDKEISQEVWMENCTSYMRNFSQDKIDSMSKIKATIKSAYKDKYVFSCNTLREILPDMCNCSFCPYDISSNQVKVYKNQLKLLLDNKVNKKIISKFFNCMKNKEFKLKKYEYLFDEENMQGPYVFLNDYIVEDINNMGQEIYLLFQILLSSNNNKTLNPKLKTSNYATRLNKSDRSIQRYMKSLEEQKIIKNKRILITQKNLNKDNIEDNKNKNVYIDVL